jgi:protease-4
MSFTFGRRGRVAVVEIHGVIGTRVRESVYSRLFDAIGRNKQYKALLLDINSPGGSATGSDLMYHSLQKVAQQKPVVAYVSGIGASGGYYLCCAASKVVALPTALVGSIGVIYLRPILDQLLSKIGIELSVFKGGHLKDMTGFWRSPTDEESEKFQGLISEMYDTFVSVVAQGRSLEDSHVRELATGEIYTARRGHENGLVDELGDFDLALNRAAELGDIRPKPRWIRPKRSFSERLTGRVGNRSPGLGLLSSETLRLLAGGMYYVEPSMMLGNFSETS